MSQHMICYIHTLPGEDLLAYIRDELDLDKLSKQLSKLLDPEKDQMKYFAALAKVIILMRTKSGIFLMNTED